MGFSNWASDEDKEYLYAAGEAAQAEIEYTEWQQDEQRLAYKREREIAANVAAMLDGCRRELDYRMDDIKLLWDTLNECVLLSQKVLERTRHLAAEGRYDGQT